MSRRALWGLSRIIVIIAVVVLLSTLYVLHNPSSLTHEESKVIESSSSVNLRKKVSSNAMIIKTSAFFDYGSIPPKYTCDGNNVNPPIIIENVPSGAKSLALIVDDPDAPNGIWTHWLVYNIAPATDFIGEGSVPQNGVQLVNDFGDVSYEGPCPPKGASHRYFFKLYALDKVLDDKAISTKKDLEDAITKSIVATSKWVGFYTLREAD